MVEESVEEDRIELDEETIKKLDDLILKAWEYTDKAQKQVYEIVGILRKKDALVIDELKLLYDLEYILEDINNLGTER